MQIHQRRAETARTSLNAHVRGAMASLSPGSPAGSGRKMARPEAIHLRIHKIDPGILGLRKHEESNKKQRVAFQDTCSGVPMGGKGIWWKMNIYVGFFEVVLGGVFKTLKPTRNEVDHLRL